MASSRISRSAIDWAKFAELVPKNQASQFNAFKARSAAYLMKVQSLPENPPAIDFESYKASCSNKEAVEKLKSAYTAIKVAYPEDTLTPVINKEQEDTKKIVAEYCQLTDRQIVEAEEYKKKFEAMIPVHEMTMEDFTLTFPDWSDAHRAVPTIWPHSARTPGLSREMRENMIQDEHTRI